ncbi:MAG: hypothetical protein J1E61_07270 [Lachnospiraceae bacterium]|nr:hypothetical protein [Lachnospiraceae bacterium]
MKEKHMKEFITKLKEVLSEMVEEGTRIDIHETVKNNDVSYPAITLMPKGINGAPSIRLDGFYYDYLEGRNIEEIAEAIFSISEPMQDSGFDMEDFLDFDSAKENILFRVVGYKQNSKRLSEIPHVRFLDLAITFYYMLEREEGSDVVASIQIQNEHLEIWEVDTETLYDIAVENTVEKMPIRIRGVFEVLTEALHIDKFKTVPDYKGSMYVLSNEKNFYGAASICYPEVLKEAAEHFDADLYIIPSSVHEVLLFPVGKGDQSDVSYFNETIRDINMVHVAAEEVLSDHLYYYDRERDELMIPSL